jgi:hypothetical protein
VVKKGKRRRRGVEGRSSNRMEGEGEGRTMGGWKVPREEEALRDK